MTAAILVTGGADYIGSHACLALYHIMPRRDGDVASSWADATRAKLELGWPAGRDMATMMADSWRWQHNNPSGYR